MIAPGCSHCDALRQFNAVSGAVQQGNHEGQVFTQVASDEKVVAHKNAGLSAHFLDLLRLTQQVADAKRRAFGGIHQKPGVVVDHLQADAAHVTTDDRFAFPHGRGDGQAEAFADGFLQDYVGDALQCIDFPMRIGRQQQRVNIGIAPGACLCLVQNRFSFRISATPPPIRVELT
jgi:hypothetical protein